MRYAVLDASVIAKFVLRDQEDDLDKTEDLIRQFVERSIVFFVPQYWVYELGNVIRQTIKGQEAQQQALSYLLEYGFQERDYSAEDYLKILKLSDEHNVAYYDAAYYYLALREDIPLLTADEKFAKRMNDHKRIILLREFHR